MTNEEREKLEELLEVADSQHVSWFIANGREELRRGIKKKYPNDHLKPKDILDNDGPLFNR